MGHSDWKTHPNMAMAQPTTVRPTCSAYTSFQQAKQSRWECTCAAAAV